jgi:hypothetical protein
MTDNADLLRLHGEQQKLFLSNPLGSCWAVGVVHGRGGVK